MSKKLINSPNNCVDECLAGLVAANPRISLHPAKRVLLDDGPVGRRLVGIVSGGGSGHEPFPAGYVGSGMLTAAVCGSVFASPPSSNILYAIRVTARISPGGVLVLIPNYTGDILNFGLAIELARAEGLQVDSVIVGDDVAQGDKSSVVGRRGMVGIVAVFKIAGSFAQQGASLAAVRAAACQVLERTASIGLAVNAATLPGAAAPLFDLAVSEMELGVGVHGEAGIKRVLLTSAKEAVHICLDYLVPFLSLSPGNRVVVLINNLGGLSQLEQWLLAGEVQKQLADAGITVERMFAAPFFTSIDMPGVQICLLRLGESNADVAAIDDATAAPAWPSGASSRHDRESSAKFVQQPLSPQLRPRGFKTSPNVAKTIQQCLKHITAGLIIHEDKLNQLDSGCGDGDCGTTLRHLADAIDRQSPQLNFQFPATLATQIAALAASTMGGTSGAIYSLFLTHIGEALATETDATLPATWAAAWRAGLQGMQKYSRARRGDRTMFDSLEPGLEAFEKAIARGTSAKIAIDEAVDAAKKGCESTKTMTARAGRASYVEAARVIDEDAGAFAVTVWLEAIAGILRH